MQLRLHSKLGEQMNPSMQRRPSPESTQSREDLVMRGPSMGRTQPREAQPALRRTAHLQHAPGDVLLTAITADTELGVVVSLAVGQSIPAMRQTFRMVCDHPEITEHWPLEWDNFPLLSAWGMPAPPALRNNTADR
jgi:hypothetical protein